MLARAMILLGLASFYMNVKYYVNMPHTDAPYGSNDQAEGFSETVDLDMQPLKGENGNVNKKGKKTFDGAFSGGQFVKKDKQGRVVVNAITALKKDQLGDAAGDDDATGALTLEEVSKGREPILDILREAGITEFDAATVAKLPMWEEVERLYGKGPAIYGLDTW